MGGQCSVLILYFGACYVRVIMVFWNVYCYLCAHAVHVFPWYISVVYCVHDQIFNLGCCLWLLVLCTNTTGKGDGVMGLGMME